MARVVAGRQTTKPRLLVSDAAIQKALAPLIALPLRCIGRAADLLWVHFGEFREIPYRKGGTRTVGDWALHVQCPWQFARPPSILIARSDCFYAADSSEPYDWDAAGKSRFDGRAGPLNREFESSPPRVVAVAADSVGGFTLRFDSGHVLEVFPDDGTVSGSECWRIFRPGRDERHFVFPDETRAASTHAPRAPTRRE